MNKKRNHLSEPELQFYVDGEFSAEQQAQIDRHLMQCWECRTLVDERNSLVRDVVHVRHAVANQHVPPAIQSREELLRRVRAYQQTQDYYPSSMRTLQLRITSILQEWRKTSWIRFASIPATACVLLAAAYFIAVHSTRIPVVNAKELLRQSSLNAEAVLSRPGYVIHQTLELDQSERGGSHARVRRVIDVWRKGKDIHARRVLTESHSLIAGDWGKADGSSFVYRGAALADQLPLVRIPRIDKDAWNISPSASDFVRIIPATERVSVESSGDHYILRYHDSNQDAKPRLLDASLTLRRSDLHPLEQDLSIEKAGRITDYRLVETKYEERPLTQEAEEALLIDPGLTGDVAHVGPMSGAAIAASVVPTASPDLIVSVLHQLDRSNALLQEQVEVERGGDGLLHVRGTLNNSQRKLQVLRELGPLAQNPAVLVSFDTVEHQISHTRSSDRRESEVQEISVDAQSGSQLLRASLAAGKGLAGGALDSEVERVTSDVLSRFTDAQQHVSALKEILKASPPEAVATLSSGSRQQWADMVAGHARAIHDDIEQVRTDLRPITGESQPSPPLTDAKADISASVIQLDAQLNRVDQMIWNLVSSPSQGAPGAVDSTLLNTQLSSAMFTASSIALAVSK